MYSSQPLPPSTYVEFTISGTDCVAKEATEAANCSLLAKKVSGLGPWVVTTQTELFVEQNILG